MFSVSRAATYGRLGQLRLARTTVLTPLLFPVVALVTGPTARGGGLWKYILQANDDNSLLRRDMPVMSQVLHFLDFSSNDSRVLDRWRKDGVRQKYKAEVEPPVDFTAPLFLDSGGYRLLWNDTIDLSRYGLSIKDDGPRAILQLQSDFGGDIVATLDYPLPPGLAASEAKERSRKSIENAIVAACTLSKSNEYRPFLFIAAHGQDRAGMEHYIRSTLRRLHKERVDRYPFGFAVGSLVPLRGSKKYTSIIEILRGLCGAIPDDMRDRIPIHVFGITGNLVPILAYLGVDSFDSSTYVQEARSLGYIDPNTGRTVPALELDHLTCECRICRHLNLDNLHNALTSDVQRQPQRCGHFKSKYYADIALHNLEIDLHIVSDTRRAIEADGLQEYLLEHVHRHPSLHPVLEALAQEDRGLRKRMGRTVVGAITVQPTSLKQNEVRTVSLKYTPTSFDIMADGYRPPEGKRVLLIIPCSGGKPYSASRSHRLIAERLTQALGDRAGAIHKVTLSGLYGPVPEERENDPAVLGYDFRLDPSNRAQIDLVSSRLVRYIERHGAHYDACLSYATSNAYRTALEQAARQIEALSVLPTKPKTRRLTEFYRQQNVEELVIQVEVSLRSADVSLEMVQQELK